MAWYQLDSVRMIADADEELLREYEDQILKAQSSLTLRWSRMPRLRP